ncbi:sigma 54-interacting transcriptional regulator [Thermodesulforhabdus norvegica]|uniref:Regulatory protein, Fis family n=1 Tax=Thermodesulforhabdus norvegica TaxID=39841 RepID=A0A1I4TS50_9BACT|nr:sigma 54-interacting transcriptional regulator [Thermodesulforhabdus norvegica]SFM79395.1 regulatory protein, Fis family [Thermodesulforhabdus norvegica]
MSLPAWFRTLMESLPVPAIFYDLGCHIAGSNEKGKKYILKTYNDLTRFKACEILAQSKNKTNGCENCLLARVLQERKPQKQTGEFMLPDGHSSIFERYAALWEIPGGPVIVDMWKDISQEVTLLREHEKKDLYIQGFFELFNLPMFITDHHFRITEMNRAFEKFARLPFSHLLGRPIDDIINLDLASIKSSLNLQPYVFSRTTLKRHPDLFCDLKLYAVSHNGNYLGCVGFAVAHAGRSLSSSFPHYQMEYLFELTREASHKESLKEFFDYLDVLLKKHFLGHADPLVVLIDEDRKSFFWLKEKEKEWPLQKSFRESAFRDEAFQHFYSVASMPTSPADAIATPGKPRLLPKPLLPFSANYPEWFGFPIATHRRLLGYVFVGLSEVFPQVKEAMYLIHAFLTQMAGHIRQLMLREAETASLWEGTKPTRFGRIIGQSEKMLEVYELIEMVAPSEATVLITGENGTGKELVALEIHSRSNRSNGPFVVAHCSAYSPTLLETELFGHEKGAFTGAIKQKKGRIERAQKGTLFLDEIGDISPATQVLLLRFLQDRKFERVGGEQTLEADVRILAATNKNLYEEVRAGRFRDDLYYRLNVISIHLPPLRERKEDIPLLCEHFVKKYSLREKKEISSLSPEALQILMEYDWPGNVRQLENAISHAVILATGDEIKPVHLPRFLRRGYDDGQSMSLADYEKNLISKVLKECNWNKHEAARRLKITRSTLYSKIKRYNLHP